MGQKGAQLHAAATAAAEDLTAQLARLGDVLARPMFGGYGVFEEGLMFALVTSEGEVHFKVDDSNRARFEEAGMERFGRMPYYAVPESVGADPDQLLAWARTSVAVARAAAKKKPKKRKR